MSSRLHHSRQVFIGEDFSFKNIRGLLLCRSKDFYI